MEKRDTLKTHLNMLVETKESLLKKIDFYVKELGRFKKEKIIETEDYSLDSLQDLIAESECRIEILNLEIKKIEKEMQKTNKYLSENELIEMEQNLKVTDAESYWKSIALGFINNINAVGDYKYNLTKENIEYVVDYLLNSTEIWETVDSVTSTILMKFEKKQ